MILRNFRQLFMLTAFLATLAGPLHATSVNDVRNAAEKFVLAKLQETALLDNAQEYTLDVGQLDSRLQLADCSQPLDTALHGQWPSAQPMVKVSCGGASPWSLYIPIEVSVYHLVATTAAPVSRGQVLDSSMVTLQKQNIMATHGRYYRSADEVTGQIARRHLSPGEPLGAHNLDMPKAIKRGDDVVISAASGPIAVKMPATALSDGRVGDKISVRNTASQRIIRATVTGPGQVVAAM